MVNKIPFLDLNLTFILRGVCLISSVRSTIGEVGLVRTFGNKSGGCPQRGFYLRAKNKAVETLFVAKTQLGLDKFHNGIRNSSKIPLQGSVWEIKRPLQGGFGLELVMPCLFFVVPKNNKGFSY
jgi:hypothetical protein